jgi:hypothetical protein
MHAVDASKKTQHFITPLLGKVKGEYHDRCHLLPCCFVTDSGIRPYDWIKKLVSLKARQGLHDEKGRVLNSSSIDQGMHEVLEYLFRTQYDLSPSTIALQEDITANYHAF